MDTTQRLDATPKATQLDYTFPISAGKAPFKITSIQSHCACLTAKVKDGKMAYAAGEKGEIQVSFALTNQTGKVAKSFAVEVEGLAEPVVLTVVADIPAAWTFGAGAPPVGRGGSCGGQNPGAEGLGRRNVANRENLPQSGGCEGGNQSDNPR